MTTTPLRTGADLLCETLLAQGVDHCFANPGTSEMHFVAALDRQPRMRCVLGLSEGVVTGAADGYARMAGRPASTLLHTGPGLANGLANLHNAKRAFTPMVNVVGDHATQHAEFDAPLAADIESLARPMSHWVARSTSADALGELAAQAVQEAMTPPGRIATLILPADHAWSLTDAPAPGARSRPGPQPPREAALTEAAAALRRPGAVLMIAGHALRDEGLNLAARDLRHHRRAAADAAGQRAGRARAGPRDDRPRALRRGPGPRGAAGHALHGARRREGAGRLLRLPRQARQHAAAGMPGDRRLHAAGRRCGDAARTGRALRRCGRCPRDDAGATAANCRCPPAR